MTTPTKHIYKYAVPGKYKITDGYIQPIRAFMQGKSVQVWCEVYVEENGGEVEFAIFPTGAEISVDWQYVDTFQDDWFVGHVYMQWLS